MVVIDRSISKLYYAPTQISEAVPEHPVIHDVEFEGHFLTQACALQRWFKMRWNH